MTAVLTSPDQRYLTEGFIVTEGGRYLGLGTGEQLVRVVTEVRIEAARHANPLTFLPGNIPLSEHIDRLLSSGGEMIRLVARTLASCCDPRRDFVGHVGGDDFVVLLQSDDWMDRCERIVAHFNEKARSLFDEQALLRGGIDADDRHGVRRFFPFTTLSIGAVPVRPGAFSQAEQVASAASMAPKAARMLSSAFCGTRPPRPRDLRQPAKSGRCPVRAVQRESQSEGCVVDEARHQFLVGQERRGVWRLPLSDAAPWAPVRQCASAPVRTRRWASTTPPTSGVRSGVGPA